MTTYEYIEMMFSSIEWRFVTLGEGKDNGYRYYNLTSQTKVI